MLRSVSSASSATSRFRSSCSKCMSARQQCIIEDGYRARPAGRGAADLVRKAGDEESVTGQRFEVVQFFEMAVADVASGFVSFPDERFVAGLGDRLGGVGERRVPAPRVGSGQ